MFFLCVLFFLRIDSQNLDESINQPKKQKNIFLDTLQ